MMRRRIVSVGVGLIERRHCVLQSIQQTPRRDNPRARRLFFVCVLLLAVVLLALAFRGVRWNDMLATVRRGRPLYLALAFVTLSLALGLRGVRWRILLNAEKPVAPLTSVWAVAVGYLGNYFLPARAGELIRSVMIGRVTALSTTYALATALTERIVDAAALVLISLVTLLSLTVMPGWLLAAAKATALIALCGIAVLFLAPRHERALRRMLALLPLPGTVQGRLVALLQEFLLGMRALQRPGRALGFILLTAVAWSIDGVTVVLVGSAFHMGLILPQALLLVAALGLASAAPSTPGYVGIYQFVAVTVLAPFGYSRSVSLVFILAFQAVLYAGVIVWGSVGLWRLSAMRRAVTASITAQPGVEGQSTGRLATFHRDGIDPDGSAG